VDKGVERERGRQIAVIGKEARGEEEAGRERGGS